MRVDRPGPGEELNEGEEVPPREAATAILMRDTDDGPEVLLLQRNPESKFMGGAWVFPGGAVHDDDRAAAAGDVPAPVVAAMRETEEEAGFALPDAAALLPFSRWITPAEVKIRFDTWFFLARAPAGVEAKIDEAEVVDSRWVRPQDALDAYSRDELLLVFPTIKHLEELCGFGSVDEALENARGRDVQPVQPRVVIADGVASVLMPGEPGYDD